MNYQDFANTFLECMSRAFINKEIKLHGLVDIDLWKQIFPDDANSANDLHWNQVKFNAFALNDEEHSLLLVYNVPLYNIRKEVQFIGIRLDNKRERLALYRLRRPQYNDDAWEVFQFDFDRNEDIRIDEIPGTNSLRDFKNFIEQISFREKPTLFEKVLHILTKAS